MTTFIQRLILSVLGIYIHKSAAVRGHRVRLPGSASVCKTYKNNSSHEKLKYNVQFQFQLYLVFISIIFQPNLILVTSPIAPVTRNSTLLVNT